MSDGKKGYQKVKGVEGLYYRKNKSGSRGYYVRLHWRQPEKRTTFRSLKTDKISIAKLRLKDALHAHRTLVDSSSGVGGRDLTVAELMSEVRQSIAATPDIRPETLGAKTRALKRLAKAWPEKLPVKVSLVTRADIDVLVHRLKTAPLSKPPPGTRRKPRVLSSSAINQSLSLLKVVFARGVSQGLLVANPAEHARRVKTVVQKVTALPSLADVEQLFFELRHKQRKNRDPEKLHLAAGNIEISDFAQGLAFTGCRISELNALTWGDINWRRNQLHVRGTKSAKSDRIVPLIPPARALFERMKAALGSPPAAASIFIVSEIQKSLDAACARAGIARMTHHDFRHFFITMCIESGVDFKTIAEWVGHSDGGVLVAKTYGHLRDEHSQSSAAKVTFGRAPATVVRIA